MRRNSIVGTLAVALSLVAASRAHADINVTGTYAATLSCKGVLLGEKDKTPPAEVTMFVTQSGLDLNFTIAAAHHYGRLQPVAGDVDGKGVASMVTCGINNELDYTGVNFQRLGRLNFKAKAGSVAVKGSFYGAGAVITDFIELCKIKATRTSAADPGVSTCP